jgi:hypothetical protein
MNDLRHSLIAKKPSEKGGQTAEVGFTYQKNWAICKLLELHQQEKDYVMVFEYHDDVLILDSSENPNAISFYQIKTKTNNNWTVSLLINKSKDNKQHSFLGKLYDNKINFPTGNLNFISNAAFSFKLEDESKSVNLQNINYEILAKSEKDLIEARLKEEFPNLSTINLKDDITFIKSNIPLQNSEFAVITALVEHFETATAQHLIPRPKPIHLALLNEINRKSQYSYDITSFDELVKCRSFTRSEFHEMIMHALKSKNLDLQEVKNKIVSRLNTERASMFKLKQFNIQCNQYLIDKLDVANEVIKRLEKLIQNVIHQLEEVDLDQELLPCVDTIYEKFSTTYRTPFWQKEKEYIHVVILFQLYGN